MTGRSMARQNPFWATGLSKMQPGCQRIARGLHGVIQRSKSASPYLWIGSGWRTGSSEHGSGRALDIIITADTSQMPSKAELGAGNMMVAWLIRHARTLGVHGIIFSRDSRRRPEIWGYSTPGRWRAFPPRGSISGDHVDHIHVYFKASAEWPASLNSSKLAPGLPSVGDGLKVVSTVSVAHLKQARYSDPPKSGSPAGPYANEVFTMETALAKTGWLDWKHVDGHFGTKTVGDGSLGIGGTTGFQRKHSGAAKPDGWLGSRELTKLFRLAGMSVKVNS